MNKRLAELRNSFSQYQIDALLVSNPLNYYYLSGFSGSSGELVIDREKAYLLTDFRYKEQAKEQRPGFQIIEIKGDIYSSLSRLLKERKIERLGCETDYLTYNRFSTLTSKLAPVRTVPVTGAVQKLRAVKNPEEINAIAESMAILDRALSNMISKLKPGISEGEIALELEFFARRQGAAEKAFDFIVASGPRSALPHGTASSRTLQPGDLVTIDFGVMYRGYASDMTRTFAVQSDNARQREIYSIVLEAQSAGLSAVRAGVKASDVDRAAREVIERYGYGPNFGHSTGHGVGLEVHENPRLSEKDDTVLETGMVVTVEPGIYIPRWGGVRIEDTVVVEDNGCRILGHFPKDRLICT